MTTIYRKPGAVHGFSVEFYRVHKGEVDFCDTHGRWAPSKWSRLDVRENLEAGYLEVVPWVYYRDAMTDWNLRFAGPFGQMLVGGRWGMTMVKPDEVPELVLRGVLVEVKAEEIPV